MWIREATHRLRCRRLIASCVLAVLPVALAACGEDDFPNDPRPASPVELTAAIDKRAVSISPKEFGAGLVVITISNQTDEPLRLALDGPTVETSDEIVPGGTASIKTSLEEGSYEVAAGAEIGIEPATLEVGPERETSQNELLLP